MIKEKTGSIEIVLFSSLVDQVSNNKSYHFKKMSLESQGWLHLEITETAKVSKIMMLLFL